MSDCNDQSCTGKAPRQSLNFFLSRCDCRTQTWELRIATHCYLHAKVSNFMEWGGLIAAIGDTRNAPWHELIFFLKALHACFQHDKTKHEIYYTVCIFYNMEVFITHFPHSIKKYAIALLMMSSFFIADYLKTHTLIKEDFASWWFVLVLGPIAFICLHTVNIQGKFYLQLSLD